jgi:hypothetical protein
MGDFPDAEEIVRLLERGAQPALDFDHLAP